jgi:hypothetical protein
MKGLTICQPYAHLVEIGDKPIENRTWPTDYRGPLVIHAGKSKDWMDDADGYGLAEAGLAFGAVVCIVDMVECLKLKTLWPAKYRHLEANEHANGPYCHIYENVRRLADPIPWRGAQGLWDVPADLERRLAVARFV